MSSPHLALYIFGMWSAHVHYIPKAHEFNHRRHSMCPASTRQAWLGVPRPKLGMGFIHCPLLLGELVLSSK